MKNHLFLFVAITLLFATQSPLLAAEKSRPTQGSLEAAQAETQRIRAARAEKEKRQRMALEAELAEIEHVKNASLITAAKRDTSPTNQTLYSRPASAQGTIASRPASALSTNTSNTSVSGRIRGDGSGTYKLPPVHRPPIASPEELSAVWSPMSDMTRETTPSHGSGSPAKSLRAHSRLAHAVQFSIFTNPAFTPGSRVIEASSVPFVSPKTVATSNDDSALYSPQSFDEDDSGEYTVLSFEAFSTPACTAPSYQSPDVSSAVPFSATIAEKDQKISSLVSLVPYPKFSPTRNTVCESPEITLNANYSSPITLHPTPTKPVSATTTPEGPKPTSNTLIHESTKAFSKLALVLPSNTPVSAHQNFDVSSHSGKVKLPPLAAPISALAQSLSTNNFSSTMNGKESDSSLFAGLSLRDDLSTIGMHQKPHRSPEEIAATRTARAERRRQEIAATQSAAAAAKTDMITNTCVVCLHEIEQAETAGQKTKFFGFSIPGTAKESTAVTWLHPEAEGGPHLIHTTCWQNFLDAKKYKPTDDAACCVCKQLVEKSPPQTLTRSQQNLLQQLLNTDPEIINLSEQEQVVISSILQRTITTITEDERATLTDITTKLNSLGDAFNEEVKVIEHLLKRRYKVTTSAQEAQLLALESPSSSTPVRALALTQWATAKPINLAAELKKSVEARDTIKIVKLMTIRDESFNQSVLQNTLCLAIKYDYIDIAETLLTFGADAITDFDETGITPLMMAARYGSPEMINWLLGQISETVDRESFTYEINQFSKEKYTALMYAARYNNNVQVAQALVEASPTTWNNTVQGKTPLTIAKKYKNNAITLYFNQLLGAAASPTTPVSVKK